MEWSGSAMVLVKLPVLLILVIIGQWLTVITVSAGGVIWTFFLSSIVSLFSSFSLGDDPI